MVVSDPSVETDDAPPSAWARVQRALAIPVRLFAALFVPDRGVAPQVASGRYAAALVAVMIASLFSAFAIGARLDFTAQVKAGPGPGGPAAAAPRGDGQPDRALPSDREVKEQIDKQRAVASLTLKLERGLAPPFWLLVNAIFLWLLAKLVAGKPTLRGTASAAALAALPSGVKALVAGAVALASPRVLPHEIDSLAAFGAISPRLAEPFDRIFRGVDAFSFWSLVILWLGFAEAARISRLRAGLTVVVLFPVSLLFWNVVMR